ncbi:amino acid permease/ SLC12A domain-containing protein [Aspergillus keveii]|uniref:Amino acid permease/ SLC12A domain-containing protein n=1 Tax=Aspergillus keveii TaxID=714993 RepID=A0ABR4G294_9EURO
MTSTTEKSPNHEGIDSTSFTTDQEQGSSYTTNAGTETRRLQRKLGVKEVQLFALSAAIGTNIFVSVGSALPKAGPAGLFLGFVIWGACILCVNECYGEMVTYMPVPSATITFASKWVDEALGFAMGWNYFLNMALLVPFEIVALSLMIGYWTDVMPAAAVVVIMMVIYLILNVIDVSWFGAAEFYIGIFKVLLAVGLTFYTFITMVGGNPQHDAYGFRYWNQPGAFAEYLVDGPSGRLCGVVAAMVQAGFTFCGPEYLGMIAAETRNPRRVIHRAYKTFLIRVLLFFVGGALCIGIVIPYEDSTLARLLDAGVSTGAASPYVISMQRLGIAGLGSVVNAGIMVSLVSAGNALLFSAARTLYGMALDGKAPRVLGVCTKKGIPIWALFVSLSFCLLGLLQVSESSAKVMNYLVILITANQLLNHFSVSLTYIHFYRALSAQGIDRNTLPYKGRFQPYTSYVAVTSTALLTLLLGFDLFVDVPNNWSIRYFCLNYAMLAFYVVMFVGWKVVRKTRYVKASEVDLGLGGAREEIEVHQRIVEDEGEKMGKFEKVLLKVVPM